jgi:lipopolysaccharide/colanic/teichoic acid biosynthesis glycosyltransferase
MLKRALDIFISIIALLLLSPILIIVALIVFLKDFHSPLYIAPRVGHNGHVFMMIKLRSMIINADKTGVDSTSANDQRITSSGHFIRRYKLDELTQLWNVLLGDMSLVGPRPNVKRETDLYTNEENGLLAVKPGITDFSSIVFSDEGEILKDRPDPDIAYNQLIRPWKSRLGLLYIGHQSMVLDIKLIFCTIVALFSREKALEYAIHLLKHIHAPEDMIQVSRREDDLIPFPPPGSNEIIVSRDLQIEPT